MVTFVILNYKNKHDTIECLQSIKKIKTKHEISTIVVDNHSSLPDDIKEIKAHCDKLIELNQNLGFANGNNKGCQYAIKKYHPDFLIVINNDTIIEQSGFVDLIYKIFKETKFDALGPQIITNGGQSVNPFKAYETLEEVSREIAKSKKLIKIYKNIILRNLLMCYFKLKYLFVKPYKQVNGTKREIGVSLHGCAIVFSKQYYERYENVFYPETFMYHEEEFLAYRRNHDDLVFVYDPEIKIFHKEGASLSKSIKNNYQKLIFREENRIQSLTKLEEIMQKKQHI